MAKQATLPLAMAVSLAFCGSTIAASVTKDGSGTDLTAAASWAGGAGPAPTAADVAIWDVGSLGAGLSLNSGTPSWMGIKINAGASDPIAIGTGGTLTLGTSGIDMSTATIDATFGCDLSFAGGYQSWLLNSGKTLAINGTVSRSAGAAVNFPATGVTSSTLANNNDILGGWATVGNAGTSGATDDWATVDVSGNIGTYASYINVSSARVPGSTENWNCTGSGGNNNGSGTINSLRVTQDFTVSSGTTLGLESGGLILSGIARWLKAGNSSTSKLQSGLGSGEFFVDVASSTTDAWNWRVWPILEDNGTTPMVVVKNGPGYVSLVNANNSYSGLTIVNDGALGVYDLAAATKTSGIVINGGIYAPGVLTFSGTAADGGTTTTQPNALGSGTITINGGALQLGFHAKTTGSVYTTTNSITLNGGAVWANDAYQHLNGPITGSSGGGWLGATYSGGSGSYNKGLSVDGLVSGSGPLVIEQAGYGGNGAIPEINGWGNGANGNTWNVSIVMFTTNNPYSGTATVYADNGLQGHSSYLGLNATGALANATVNLVNNNTSGSALWGNSPLLFQAGLGSDAFTLGGLSGNGNVILTEKNEATLAAGNPVALSVGNNDANTTYSGVMSGGGSLTKIGAGTLQLSGANTYTGGTGVSNGTLQLEADSNLGAVPGSPSVNVTLNGGTLYNNNTSPSLSANRTISLGSSGGYLQAGWKPTHSLTVNGKITGTGALGINWDGIVVLAGSGSDYQGDTTIGTTGPSYWDSDSADPTLRLGVDNAIPYGASAGNVVFGYINNNRIPTLDLNGHSAQINGLVTSGGAVAIVDNVLAGGACTLTVGDNDQTSTFGGTIKNTSGTVALTKIGSGTQNLSGVNTYSGGTTVSAGILGSADNGSPGTNSPFGAGSIVVSGGQLQLGTGVGVNNFSEFNRTNSITLNNGTIYENDGFQHLEGPMDVGAGGGTLGSTYSSYDDPLLDNFSKGLFVDGLLTGSGNLTIQHSGLNTGNNYSGSLVYFTSTGSAAENTYSGTITVHPFNNKAGSYLYLIGPNALANATINLSGNNTHSRARFGAPALIFGSGTSSAGVGYATIGGLSGNGSFILADTLVTRYGSTPGTGQAFALSVGNNNSSTTYSGGMSGGGSLIKIGSGTLTLSGTNTYSGATTVSGGSLLVNGSLASGTAVTVNGGTLGGTGMIGGPVTVASGGAVAPGASVESLASGALDLQGGSTFEFEFDSDAAAASSADLLVVSGNLTLSDDDSAVLNVLNDLGAGTLANGTVLSVINYSGSWDSDLFTINGSVVGNGGTFSMAGYDWTINYDATTGGVNFPGDQIAGHFVNITVVAQTTSSGVDVRAYQAADGIYVEFTAYDVESDGTIMLALKDGEGNVVWSGSVAVTAGAQSVARFLVPGLELGQSYNFLVRDEVGKWWEADGVTVGSFESDLTEMTLAGLTITFDSQPDRAYAIQWTASLGGEWQTVTNVTATAGQTSVVVEYPEAADSSGFFRIMAP